MVSFENALDTAKSRIARWNDFAGLDEVNLVRDAKGRISVYVVPQNHYTVAENSVDVLKNDLTTNIGGFFSDTIFVEGAEDWTKDLFDKIHELRVEDQDPPSGANTSVKWYVVVRRHIAVGANRTVFSPDSPTRLCRAGTYRAFLPAWRHVVVALFERQHCFF